MSEPIQTFWCSLDPCHSLRYRGLSHSCHAADLEKFSSAGEFRTHLTEEHDFSIDRALNLKTEAMWHGDGPTHYYHVHKVISERQVVGYLDEAYERVPEDAALWGVEDGA